MMTSPRTLPVDLKGMMTTSPVRGRTSTRRSCRRRRPSSRSLALLGMRRTTGACARFQGTTRAVRSTTLSASASWTSRGASWPSTTRRRAKARRARGGRGSGGARAPLGGCAPTSRGPSTPMATAMAAPPPTSSAPTRGRNSTRWRRSSTRPSTWPVCTRTPPMRASSKGPRRCRPTSPRAPRSCGSSCATTSNASSRARTRSTGSTGSCSPAMWGSRGGAPTQPRCSPPPSRTPTPRPRLPSGRCWSASGRWKESGACWACSGGSSPWCPCPRASRSTSSGASTSRLSGNTGAPSP
mmetsp:Transcript_14781/g.47135  ORF Transcript_14781/g.47135 Transcript_14781/m.47135 type:complete len:297 (-) Transcript_14781:991-1881(-)